jgi:hypothetical protein
VKTELGGNDAALLTGLGQAGSGPRKVGLVVSFGGRVIDVHHAPVGRNRLERLDTHLETRAFVE